jgi:hypothetical protein
MAVQDYFLFSSDPLFDFEGDSPYSSNHSRTSSVSSNATLRELFRRQISDSPTPPGCRTISFSHWTRFSTSSDCAPPGELKASSLCKASGLASCYDPPASEWTYLGADQPVVLANKVRRKKVNRSSSACSTNSSLSTASSDSSDSIPEAISFQKKALTPVNTASALTQSLQMSANIQMLPQQQVKKTSYLKNMNYANLPSAFDSDSDDDD